MDETNTTVVTVVRTPLPARDDPNDRPDYAAPVPKLDPARIALTTAALRAYAAHTGHPGRMHDSEAEVLMRAELAGVAGRAIPPVTTRPGHRSVRVYAVGPLRYRVSADNQAVLGIFYARRGVEQVAAPPTLTSAQMGGLETAEPRCSSRALGQFTQAHSGDDATRGLHGVVHGAAQRASIRPGRYGYRVYLHSATVYLSADLQTITEYRPGVTTARVEVPAFDPDGVWERLRPKTPGKFSAHK